MTSQPSHHLQWDIINRLSRATVLRFSELKADGLESNIFMYHLNQLIKQKLVDKTDEGYLLSPRGLLLVDRMSFTSKKVREQPKVMTILYVQNYKKQTLLWKRKVQPFIDRVTLIQGKLHLGDDSKDAANRELFEKTGLQNVKLSYRGSAHFHYIIDGEQVSDVIALIYSGGLIGDSPTLIEHNLGQAFWVNPAKEPSIMPDYQAINEQLNINNHSLFFTEQTFEV